MSNTPKHRFVSANGIKHHLVEQGKGPLVLLLHGFPEGWFSWRKQIGPLADAGYHVVAPDTRGYGQTDAPAPIASYSTGEHVADALGIVEALGEETAVVVGHDWGAGTAWQCALSHPARFRAVAALAIPLTPHSPAPPIAILRKRFQNSFFYMVYFQEPGVAEAELEANPRRTLRLTYYHVSGDATVRGHTGPGLLDGLVDPPVLPSWLTEEDLDVAEAAFKQSGFRGPLNRYRTMDADWEEFRSFADQKVTIPALFIGGDRDPSLLLRGVERGIEDMKRRAPDLRRALVMPGVGHWVHQERPAETNAALIEFLRQLP